MAFEAALQLNKSFSSLLAFAFVKLLFDEVFVNRPPGQLGSLPTVHIDLPPSLKGVSASNRPDPSALESFLAALKGVFEAMDPSSFSGYFSISPCHCLSF